VLCLRNIAVVAGTAALIAGVEPGGSAGAGTRGVAATNPAGCPPGYVSALVNWRNRCLHAGQSCRIGNPAYRRYGFVCPPSGHLRRVS